MTAEVSETVAKVLVIEDNANYAEELRRAFRSNYNGLSFKVLVVGSEAEAQPFIQNDDIDIYIVDLELPALGEAPSERVGERLVHHLVQNTNSGVIVHTGILRKDREDFLWGGVDDFIQKGEPPSRVVAKAFAVWRRVNAAGRSIAKPKRRTRKFRIGKWRFEEGNRHLSANDYETVRLSPTELAFIQYLCTIDTEIDRREFNVAVLARPAYEEDKRVDNLVYRLREKLGDTFQLIPRHRDGTYKLIGVEELYDE